MSTMFYIKDVDGTLLSADGKSRFRMLKGEEVIDFLRSEEGRDRCFYIFYDDNNDKIGIEISSDEKRELMLDAMKKSYSCKTKEKYSLTFISLNAPVSQGDENFDLVETIADDAVDVMSEAIKNEELGNLRKALLKLTPKERELIHSLYLAKTPLTEAELAKKLGISQQAVSKRKKAVFKKIKKFFWRIVK